jgi:hypothetical protein
LAGYRPLNRFERAYWSLRDRLGAAIRRPFDRAANVRRIRDAGIDLDAVPGPTWSHALIWWLEQQGADEMHRVALGWNWDNDTMPLRYIIDRPDCDRGTALTIFFSAEPDRFASHNRHGPYHDPNWQHLFASRLVDPEDRYMAEDGLWLLRRISENWAAGLYRSYRFYPGENAVFYLTQRPEAVKIRPDNMPWPVPADLCDSVPQGEKVDERFYSEGFPPVFEDLFAMRPDILP